MNVWATHHHHNDHDYDRPYDSNHDYDRPYNVSVDIMRDAACMFIYIYVCICVHQFWDRFSLC